MNPAINTAEVLMNLNPDNAYSYAYLSFLYLYDWKPRQAELALQRALDIAPEVVEFKYLDGISALMQGKLWKAWRIVKETGILYDAFLFYFFFFQQTLCCIICLSYEVSI